MRVSELVLDGVSCFGYRYLIILCRKIAKTKKCCLICSYQAPETTNITDLRQNYRKGNTVPYVEEGCRIKKKIGSKKITIFRLLVLMSVLGIRDILMRIRSRICTSD
jgi:hypothetical protein